ncbi:MULTISPECIES: helix-turn-helix transcriptional regulator [unclassified Micromonospora]|uniref:helix-turn-helix transcriptional regulator n=1 Tax=unclassified Micromonospora TaxID=2617518 RepID=UPI001C234CCA|nr:MULTISPECIES: helix-turn-helix transcriptional regulator [unclassified Micromonospora]MBU8860641.1 helix-turn-helix transcriptional regulator [Micromonospora sp. WMMB482]MDM4780180.1 helix-turn-helix transcriptional regulator [Micromonospora sp. b486]
MYREWDARDVPGAVVWSSVSGGSETRVLPDGCLDLLWSSRIGLLVAGPDRTAHLSRSAPGDRWIGLRLPPGTGPAVFGVPAEDLRDRRVPLADLWGRAAAEVTERVEAALAAPGAGTAAAVLIRIARDRLRVAGGPDPIAAHVAARLAAGASVAATAAEVGLGERALHRRSRALFGYGPKTLARILRMRRALDLARTGAPLAEVAARSGYADQAHLTREVRDLAGVPPTRLLAPARSRPRAG